MYLQHYNLQQLPFRNTPDPRFFYETPRHNEALANLVYAVEQRRGFVLLSGEIGSGKTLVTHLLLQHLEDHAQIALIRNTHLNSSQLIRLVCDEFSVQVPAAADKAAMLLSLNQFLIQQLAEDRLVVIIIDEAQNLSDKVLEELRMLSNLETSSDKLLQIVLVGQPELRDKVSQPHLEQLRQRIALSYHLEPLTLEEIAQYIQHRLKVAAGDGSANVEFTPEAVAKIARFSRGTPRIINGLCDNALLYGFTAQTHTIDEGLIDKVLKHSMHLVPKQHTPTRSPLNAFGGSRPPARRPNPVEPPSFPETPEPDAGPGVTPSITLRSNLREEALRETPRPQPVPQPVAGPVPGAEIVVPEDPGLKKVEGGKGETIAVPPIIPFPLRQSSHSPAAAQQ
jgi:general secretion pathway protein A